MRTVETVELKCKRVRPGPALPIPNYRSEFASGMDLYADIEVEILLQPLERKAIPTGLAIEIPPGYEGQVRPRSGLALKEGVTCLNSPGTIDADYRGEVRVILINRGKQPYTVHAGDRIAQMIVARYEAVEWAEGDLAESHRGANGFGSSGR